MRYVIRSSMGSNNAMRRWNSSLSIVASAVLLGTAVAACSSSASSSAAPTKDSFYRGKTITYIVPNNPGTTPAKEIVAMKPYIEKYLGATLNIQYNTGNVIAGQEQIASAAPNGLTVGEFGIPTDLAPLYTNSPTVDFSLNDVTYFGASHQGQSLVVACSGSPYSSFEQVISSNKQVTNVDVANTNIDEEERILMQAWNVQSKYITGYTATTQKAGCQRGDANMTVGNATNFLTSAGNAVTPGETALLATGLFPASSPNAFLNGKVPTLADFAKEHPPTTAAGKQGIQILVNAFDASSPQLATFGPAGIPQAAVTALGDAMVYAGKQPSVVSAFAAVGLPAGILPAATVKAFIAQSLKQVPTVKGILGAK